MDKELFNALEALARMWNQYCPPPYTHMFMSAGEYAEEILDKYDLLKNEEVDEERLEHLRRTVNATNTPPQ